MTLPDTQSNATLAPRVLVLMAVYNGERWLSEQIDSVLNQVGVEVNLLISVDLSTDDSLGVCAGFADRHHNVEVLNYGVRYGSATENFSRLIAEADITGNDFVAFCDQDDIWDSEKLIASVTTIANGEYAAVSSDVTAFWSDGRRRHITKSQPQQKYDYVLEAAGPGSTYVLTAPVFLAYKKWLSDRLTEELPPHDWLLYAYCRIYGHAWFIIPESTVLYRQHADNFLGANVGFRGRLERIRSLASGQFQRDVARLEALFGADFPVQTSRFSLLRHWPRLRRKRLEAFVFALLCLAFW